MRPYAPLVRKLNRGEQAGGLHLRDDGGWTVLLALYARPAVLATDWAALPGVIWVVLPYVAVAASALTFVLLQYATLRLPAAR